METALAILVGILVATGVYLMLARNLLRYLFGLVLLSNAANLAILAAGRLTRATPPLVPPGMMEPPLPVANPLPQALILTAIVIGFGLLAFALALLTRSYQQFQTLDSDQIREAEPVKEKKMEEAQG
ncbi:Na+/H+ antiporter subunit C [Biformimicrobium ophioploci]|uniref:Na+/H+ antiporter subunit C n=1 Tax=Biformimicrobium ophioploci TaxID=3036711 RepID=A0ABQ6LYF2_9GAMM|nr:Na+/H+ antiporter subunit C [Microbulbifer sp. NKW57]GMG87083.1 Na+/H+ antiporter subunit C [Microbulbifer sp. NKW57]